MNYETTLNYFGQEITIRATIEQDAEAYKGHLITKVIAVSELDGGEVDITQAVHLIDMEPLLDEALAHSDTWY